MIAEIRSIATVLTLGYCLLFSISALSEELPAELPPLTVSVPENADLFALAAENLTPLESAFVKNHAVLRVAVAAVSFPPYQVIENGNISGHSIQFLQEMANANGFELEYIFYDTWQEVLTALENRSADLTPVAGITEERRDFLLFTAGITPNPAGIVGKVSDDRLQTNPQLKGLRVAVGKGYVAESYLDMQFPEAEAVPVDSAIDALNLINEDAADLYYGTLSDIFFSGKPQLLENLEIKQRVFFSTGWNHIAIRSDWPLVKRLFDKFIHHGRVHMDPVLADVLGDRMRSVITPLTTTISETEFLSQFTSLRVATTQGLPLLNDIDSHGHHVGISSEYTAHIAYQLGLPVELISYANNEEILSDLAAGKVDVIPYFAITEERKKALRFTNPYMHMPWIALGRLDNTRFWDLGSLDNKTLALRKNHPLMPVVSQKYPLIKILVTDHASESVEAVAKGKADATIETKLYVNRMLTQKYAGTLEVLGEVKDDPGAFAFAVDPENEALIPILNRALAAMPADVKDRVLHRWVAVNFEPERQLRAILRVLVPAIAVLGLFLLAALYWNRRISLENRRRLKAERQLVDMTDQLRTGVFQIRQNLDKSIVVDFHNRTTRRMSRVTANTTSYLEFFQYIDESERDHVQRQFTECLNTGRHFRETFKFDFPDGNKGWILAEASGQTEADGSRVWTGYLIDLTSERMMSEELNSMLLARDEFMSMASHELRTPVQNASLTLDSIDREALPAEARSKLDSTSKSLEDLNLLVNDILHLTSMNHHSAVLGNEPLELHELINTVCSSFSAMARKKAIDFSIYIDPQVPHRILGDELRIKQVLYNIIGNAIKYTDTGSVRVEVTDAQKNDDNKCRWLKLKISDTGIGIPEGTHEKIFEPFAMLGPESRRSSGLGLALSDRLVAVMGGNISVTSSIGEGSEFVVTLPIKALAGDGSGNSEKHPDEDTQWFKDSDTLLVVDDNVFTRVTTASLLAGRGWTVLQADDGREALEILDKENCRAVITDLQMPNMTGLELAKEIRRNTEDNQARPVLILVTGGPNRPDSNNSFTDFDAILFKPVKVRSIERAVSEVVSGSEAVSEQVVEMSS